AGRPVADVLAGPVAPVLARPQRAAGSALIKPLMRSVVAVILAGGQGERLSVLSAQRAKPAVPFAGKYRIIDFTLSNCVNSGIYRVAVLTQYRPHSLNLHIGIGRPWDPDRNTAAVRIRHAHPR